VRTHVCVPRKRLIQQQSDTDAEHCHGRDHEHRELSVIHSADQNSDELSIAA
jgi:hypothetical protein